MNNEFSGVWSAIATPFLSDHSIDWESFEKLVSEQVAARVTGIVVCGTTGESPTLSNQEKLSLIRKAKAIAKNEIQLMAGTGGNNTQQSCELSKLAIDSGADALLIVTPPYNKPSMEGLKNHFQQISLSCPKTPICLYHVPGRTSQFLDVDQIESILDHVPMIKMVKESSGNISFFSNLHGKLPNTCLLSGDDPTYLASIAVGGQGCISVLSNIFPEELKQMTSLYAAGRVKEALALNLALLPVTEALFIESNPGPLKVILEKRGLGGNFLRAPLAPVSKNSYDTIMAALDSTSRRLSELK